LPASSGVSETLRFWWIRNGQNLGLVFVALILVAIVVLVRPTGRATVEMGVVSDIYVAGGRGHAPFHARVDLNGRPIMIELPADHACFVGSPIQIARTPTRFGVRYASATGDCRRTSVAG
jgi:uncharacterized protein (DUF58 family)